ncbi:MAG: hypothetical protein ACTSRB_15245 [Candidatus Helarchaeota archaeon]
MEAFIELKGYNKFLKKLDKRNFFTPGSKILWKIAARILGLNLKKSRIHVIGTEKLQDLHDGVKTHGRISVFHVLKYVPAVLLLDGRIDTCNF